MLFLQTGFDASLQSESALQPSLALSDATHTLFLQTGFDASLQSESALQPSLALSDATQMLFLQTGFDASLQSESEAHSEPTGESPLHLPTEQPFAHDTRLAAPVSGSHLNNDLPSDEQTETVHAFPSMLPSGSSPPPHAENERQTAPKDKARSRAVFFFIATPCVKKAEKKQNIMRAGFPAESLHIGNYLAFPQ